MPSVREAPSASVTAGSGMFKSYGSSISMIDPGSMGYSAPISNNNLNVQMDSVVLIGLSPSHSIGSTMMFLILFAVNTILSDSP